MERVKAQKDLFPTQKVELPRQSVVYEVPVLPHAAEKEPVITAAYIRWRVEAALQFLEQRAEIHVGRKHFGGGRDEAVRQNVARLREELSDAMNELPIFGVTDHHALAAICKKIKAAVHRYKADRTANIAAMGTLAEVLLSTEKQALEALFQLPTPSAPEAAEQQPPERESLQAFLGQTDAFIIELERMAAILKVVQAEEVLHNEALISLQEQTEARQRLFEKFGSSEDINGMPPGVRGAVLQEFQMLRNELVTVAQFIERLILLAHHAEQIQPAHFDYFTHTLQGKKSELALRGAARNGIFSQLENLEKRLRTLASSTTAVNAYLQGKQTAVSGLDKALLRSMAETILKITPLGDERQTLLLQRIFGAGVSPEAPTQIETVAAPGQDDDTAPAPHRGFAVKSATEDEVREEAKIRMIAGLAIVRYLQNNLPELRRVLARLTLTHLQSLCSMHNNWVGGGARGHFRTPPELFQKVFPEAYGAGISESLPRAATVGRSAPRVQWHMLDEEAQKEACRQRLFEGWSLIRELYEAQEWQALNELCGLLQTHDLKQWRINFEGMKSAGIGFATMKEFFPAVFPEAFTSSPPSSAADSSK